MAERLGVSSARLKGLKARRQTRFRQARGTLTNTPKGGHIAAGVIEQLEGASNSG
jgi:hypothetical protein